MANPNANPAALASGASTAVGGIKPPEVRVTAADLYPMRMQTLSNIEGNSAIGALQFPSDRAKYYMTLGLHDYSRSPSDLMGVIVQAMGKLNITNTITLPLPQQMIDSHSVNYAEEALGQGLGASTEGSTSLINAMAGNMSNVTQGLAGILGAGASTFLQGIKDFTGLNAPALTQALAGVAPNQFLTILLKGPQYKKHSFTWKLSPRNEGESESIRRIIELLNNSMAPGMSAAGNAFFSFPKIVTLSFMPNSNVLYRFKPAVIENMTVNYAPSGAPAFYRRTEAPDTVEIKLDFLEVEYWLTGDFGGTALDTSGLSNLRAQQGGRAGRGV